MLRRAAMAGICETRSDRLGYTITVVVPPRFSAGASASEALCLKVCFNPCTC